MLPDSYTTNNDNPEQTFLPLQDLSDRNASLSNYNEGRVAAFASWFATGPLKRARYKDFSSIDWLFDNYKDRERLHLLKNSAKSYLGKLKLIYEMSQTWIILLLVGITIGIFSTFISVSTQWLIDLKDGYCSTGFYLNQKFCCWMTEDFCEDWVTWGESIGVTWSIGENLIQFLSTLVDAIVFSALSTFLVTFYSPYAAGQGIAELKTIMSGFLIREFLSIKTMLIKSVSVVLAVASGLQVGKEVSLVHISACATDTFSKLFPSIANSEAQQRKLISAASAAGFSVAFGAPIAGVLFSLEYLDPFRNGKLVPFQNVYERTWQPFELGFFVFIGIVGGIIGAIIIRLNSLFFSYRLRSRINKYARGEVVAIAAVTVIVCYGNIFARSDSVTLVSNLFTELSSEIAVPTGIFLPSMAIGACFGRALGIVLQDLNSSCLAETKCITPAVYALVGAAAVLSSTTGMRVSVVVVMFELTGALVYVLPLMVAVTVSTWIAKLISQRDIFGSVIRLHEYPYLEKEKEYNIAGTARGIMTPVHNIVYINSKNQTLESLEALIYQQPTLYKNNTETNSGLQYRPNSISENRSTQYQGFPIIHSLESMHILGYISANDLKLGLETAFSSNSFDPSTKCYFGSISEFSDGVSISDFRDSTSIKRSFSSQFDLDVATTSTYPINDIPEYSEFEESDSINVDLRPYMDISPLTVFPETPIVLVIEMFRQLGIRQVLVAKDRVLYGIITKKDILKCADELDQPYSFSIISYFFPSLARGL
ncbi:hypothetical protein BB560_004790 [Smittium megazygosporum]|uniref:Chloride channel protein n=1 Tax=Smittium megazygosporum TaxID=133381 RepID=A0A2T9Z893_9FUNG|nr:hypothetical protein BB560_004790 [Smittium megazygosporum]